MHTPTAVAAARGTVIYFDVGMTNNQSYSKIICLEGNVQIRNIVSTVSGQVTLTPGTMVVVKANEPPPPPVPAPPAELDRARRATQSSGESSRGGANPEAPPSGEAGVNPPVHKILTDPITRLVPVTPPIQQQPPLVPPSKVNITVTIPVPVRP